MAPRPIVETFRVEIPGKVAEYLTEHEDLSEAEQHALRAVLSGQADYLLDETFTAQ